MFEKVPRIIRFLLFSVLINLLIFSSMRIAFFLIFRNLDEIIPFALLWKSFYLGFKFDLRLALLINLPLLFLFNVRKIHAFESVSGKRLWTAYFSLSGAVILLFYIFDFGHYAYLQTRLNAAAFKLLANPLISLKMLWETYPVISGIAGIGLFSALYGYAYKRVLYGLTQAESISRKKQTAVVIFTAVFFAAGIYGKFSYYPLRWSDAFFSTRSFASNLALNPALYFFDTFKSRDEGFDIEKVKTYYPLIADYLGVNPPYSPFTPTPTRLVWGFTKGGKEGYFTKKIDFSRRVSFAGKQTSNKKINIIIVLLESFAAYKSGIFGNPLNPTPHMDGLAKNSWLFRRFYVPSEGTARSVFTLVAGIPDIEINATSSRNPAIVKQSTVLNAFKGYEKFYFLGGSATWANIRGLLFHNVPGLKIYEEGSYDSSRVDVWGISDLNLFEEANRVLKKSKGPFIAIIQTSGSHRPYTIPKDNRGFKVMPMKDEETAKYGFVSSAEFNSFRFLDHSVGFFMETAGKEKYFENTVFVFLADHGLPGKAPHMGKAEELLELTRFHVPFLIYFPKATQKGAVFDGIVTEMDVLPTLASMAGIPHLNTGFGRDMFDRRFDKKRRAFTLIADGPDPTIGLLTDKFYFAMNRSGKNKRLHDYHSKTPGDNLFGKHPEISSEMENFLNAFYETARYVRYHNHSR
ncbi:MAG: sulfatase-like hydrolase/transferase [Elusimicrobia bacterium]|nr:sulfatase-like hydrolase/transferase [Elusimicrobiota bacterium]